ncbi:MAG: hypothetical protein ACJZ46_04560 [Candidatus Thalassarchaeaceae archaeon]
MSEFASLLVYSCYVSFILLAIIISIRKGWWAAALALFLWG